MLAGGGGCISIFECQWQHWTVKRSLCALSDIWGVYQKITWCHTDISLYLPLSWGVTLTFPYIFLLLDCFEFALIDCIEKQRAHSELWQFQMGDISYDVPCFTLTFPYIFLLVDCFEWALIDHIEKWRDHSELWQFRMGGYIVRCTWCHTDISLYLPLSWGVTLTFPYIFLLLDCFEFALIDRIEKRRAPSELWQFWMGGYIIRCAWCHTDISLYLPISWGVTLTFPDIFLLLDCFEFALIDRIEKRRAHSELWQFQMGGYIVRCTWCHTDISLYLPISWLFWMGSHWPHWKVKSSLWALAVSNGGVYCKMYLVSHWHFLISSYYLTVSNGLSLTTLKSKEFTLSSGSLEWGGSSSVLPG